MCSAADRVESIGSMQLCSTPGRRRLSALAGASLSSSSWPVRGHRLQRLGPPGTGLLFPRSTAGAMRQHLSSTGDEC